MNSYLNEHFNAFILQVLHAYKSRRSDLMVFEEKKLNCLSNLKIKDSFGEASISIREYKNETVYESVNLNAYDILKD